MRGKNHHSTCFLQVEHGKMEIYQHENNGIWGTDGDLGNTSLDILMLCSTMVTQPMKTWISETSFNLSEFKQM